MVISKDSGYILNYCAKHLARDNADPRHSYWGTYDDQPRARVSESWRFPIIDSHDGTDVDAYEWNDVSFVYTVPREGEPPASVEVVTTCHVLYEPISLEPVDDSIYRSVTLKVRKGERHRYKLLVDGVAILDPLNPQTEMLSSGDVWSSFFTWACTQPISFEPWEVVLLDRLTRHILPFNSKEAQNFLQRIANEGSVGHLHRLDISSGAVNYIDKLVAREERHQLYAYKTCLEMLDRILRARNPGKDLVFLPESQFLRIYGEMADNALALFADGWDANRYGSPSYFLWLLRRHTWTGAFAHPKYGGNPGGMAWAYLAERFTTDAGDTAFFWRQAIEPPLGSSPEYRG